MINSLNESSSNAAIDKINWTHVLALECSYTVDSIGSSGRFAEWMALAIAKEDKSVARDKAGKIIGDYRQ